ncbi:MAG: molybdopterin-binding protein [Nitrospirota bacterium]|nr:molybdopterin-binding protein [Nitrospirota bacterium]MDH5768171.1 molybdopterin-binding protein [Nitrospirota bacterium]
MTKRAGIIIIGDEILSGLVQDSNALFMVKELRQKGIDVRQVSFIKDDVDDIAREVKIFSEAFDYVFTSGGIGPTHDDMSIEGISKAFNVRTVIDGQLRAVLEKMFKTTLTPEQLRMAEVPEGAEVISDDSIGIPLIKYKNVYIFPGIPELLKKKFFVIEKMLFTDHPPLIKKVYIKEIESRVAPILNEIVKNHRNVKIGSYPFINIEEFNLMITLESYESNSLQDAFQDLMHSLPRDKIVKVEEK